MTIIGNENSVLLLDNLKLEHSKGVLVMFLKINTFYLKSIY